MEMYSGFCIISLWFHLASASYLGYPRIHFAGQYRIDVNTRNNIFCNYRVDEPISADYFDDYNPSGTNEFQTVNTKVTAVYHDDGALAPSDSLVGESVIDNLNSPYAKSVGLGDRIHTALYGMQFGIQWNKTEDKNTGALAFRGKWVPNQIAQSYWSRVKCYNEQNLPYEESFSLASQFTTVITDIDWQNWKESEVLTELKEAIGNHGNLSVRATLYYYTRNFMPHAAHNASYGYWVGVIGASSPSDTLNVPGERVMLNKLQPIGLKFDQGQLSYETNMSLFDPWTNTAPFEVDTVRNEVRLDLSNSLPTDVHNSMLDIGTLRPGILMGSCVYLLGNETGLPYTSNEDFLTTSAIYAVPVNPSLMNAVSNHPLVLAQVLANEHGSSAICNEGVSSARSAQILLQEQLYFIRPTGHYRHYLDRRSNPESRETLYVTSYGRPVRGIFINVSAEPFTDSEQYEEHLIDSYTMVIPTSPRAITNSEGIAVFSFKISENISIPEENFFSNLQCATKSNPAADIASLPIGYHQYLFSYCLPGIGGVCQHSSSISSYIIAFADAAFTRPYTWVKDVGPIFKQYAHITPAMKSILDLSSYREVIQPQNLYLLNLTLRLDFNDPSYMPTTRDLSPTKRDMILEWLEDPRYDTIARPPPPPRGTFSPLIIFSSFTPPRCKAGSLHFHSAPHEHDVFFEDILSITSYYDSAHISSVRPLHVSKACTASEIKQQLQTAIELEWATIPIYLTTLYSIVDGYNKEIYDLIQAVIVQEMLHMTQAANILIAMNGSPLIDHPRVTPSFPVTGLPGGVLPNLNVSLERLSLEHVYSVFMGIEMPQRSSVGYPVINNNKNTIGAFYNEIRDCIDYLGDGVFDPSTVDRQVKWPWTAERSVGNIVPVTDAASAHRAIDVIISQGEGTGLLDPSEIGSETLAHFYMFEEIVCQNHLEKVNDFHYAYSGTPIQFVPKGVWPMRSNPTVATVPPNTNCYIESRAFHDVYRMLLRAMQETFNGHPEGIFTATELMASLKGHAKRLMTVKFNLGTHQNDEETCGPVWDYVWPLN